MDVMMKYRPPHSTICLKSAAAASRTQPEKGEGQGDLTETKAREDLICGGCRR